MKEPMKMFRFDIDTTCTHWETCRVFVEAETEAEAREKFNKDPWAFEWDGWNSIDSDLIDWEIDEVNEDAGFGNTGEKSDESS